MSNETTDTELLSEQQIIDWMKVKSRTFGWDCLLLYDRLQTNILLLQEYINRYAAGESLLDPITRKMTIVSGSHWEYLYNTVLDRPRISFEKSTIGDSRAMLSMAILGGTHLTVEQGAGESKRVTKVELYDPMQAPKLTVGVRLNDSDGSVGKDNAVKISLVGATDFRLNFGTTARMQRLGGEFFEFLFNELPDEKKVFVLNTLEQSEYGDFLLPEEFRVRVMPAPGASVRDSGHYGDGAVMVFVAAKNSAVGGLPDAESVWVYPIPAGRSSTLLVGSSFLVRTLLARALAASPYTYLGQVDMDYQGGDEGASGFRVRRGHSVWKSEEVHPSLGKLKLTVEPHLYSAPHPSGGFAEFSAQLEKEQIEFLWQGNSSGHIGTVACSRPVDWDNPDSGLGDYVQYRVIWKVKRAHAFARTQQGGITLVESGEDETGVDLEIQFGEDDFPGQLPLVNEFVLQRVKHFMDIYFATFVESIREIDLFRLHGLLFQGGNVVEVASARLPYDLAMFGDLSPSSTAFVVEPMEQVVLEGSTLELKVSPPQSGLSWAVWPVEGFDGETGEIDGSGKYTAPTSVRFAGSYTMVRVSASKGQQSSSALIRVVTRAVMANPLVGSVSIGNGVLKVSGGAIDGGALSWTIKSETGATLSSEPPESDVEFEENARFYLAGSSPSGAPFSLDEVTATNPRTGASSTSYVVVIEKMMNGTIAIKTDADIPADQIQLELHGGLGPIPGATWTVIAGGGSITDEGVYSMDANSSHRFAVVTGSFVMQGIAAFHGYLILPIPLMDLEDIQRALA